MNRMRELVDRLNETAYQYYTLDAPTISDKEWDALYDDGNSDSYYTNWNE